MRAWLDDNVSGGNFIFYEGEFNFETFIQKFNNLLLL
jgi:hypothetical protein